MNTFVQIMLIIAVVHFFVSGLVSFHYSSTAKHYNPLHFVAAMWKFALAIAFIVAICLK
jgi:hypothetical protein